MKIFIICLCAVAMTGAFFLFRENAGVFGKIIKDKDIGILDASGRSLRIRVNEFFEKRIFLQFLDPLAHEDMTFFRRVIDTWGIEESLVLFAATRSKEAFYSAMGEAKVKNLFVLVDVSEKAAGVFRTSYSNGTYFLIDLRNNSIVRGDISKDSKFNDIQIRRFVRKIIPSLDSFIPVGRNIQDLGWMTSVRSAIESQKQEQSSIVLLYRSFCISCPEGEILNRLIHRAKGGERNVIVVFSESYTLQDASNFKKIFGLDIPVLICDIPLAAQWNKLKEDFLEPEMTNIVFEISREGIITKRADSVCGCQNEIFI